MQSRPCHLKIINVINMKSSIDSSTSIPGRKRNRSSCLSNDSIENDLHVSELQRDMNVNYLHMSVSYENVGFGTIQEHIGDCHKWLAVFHNVPDKSMRCQCFDPNCGNGTSRSA